MTRLIDADALLDDVRAHCESYFADDFAREWVDKQPTVDAVPVKNGEWLSMYCSSVFGGSASAWGSSIAGYMCSECDGEIGIDDDYDYCPYCGSRNVKKDD